MGSEVRTFRIPIMLTVLMLLALGYWAWQAGWGGERHVLAKASYRGARMSEMLASVLTALHQNSRLGRDEIERILTDLLHASPYRFLILEHEGRRILQIGEVPAELTSPPQEGGSFVDGTFLFCRKLRLAGREENQSFWKRFLGGESQGLDIPGDEQLLILGGNIQGDHEYDKALLHLLVPFAAAFLLLCVSAAVWIMTIRNRLLVAQLKTERTRSAHLEDLGLAAAGLAHETKNPLGIISGIAQQIARDPQVPEQSRVMIETIIDEVDKSASRLGHFMTFARRREIAATPVDARKLIAGIAEILQPEIDAAGVTLETDCTALTVVADEEMLRQIIVNLLLNSLQASSPGGVITVRLKRHGARASLVVEDQGRGIPRDLLPTIFKPYVTGSPDGHGLGLAIVKRFVEDHGWTVEAESQLHRGTQIKVSGIVLSGEARTYA
ncbi:MAG: sensor histidine kinase [Desulfobaccales bacterium]